MSARARLLAKDDDADPMVPLFRVMFDGVFTDLDDPEDVKAGYERHLEQVRAEIHPGRLVEWQPGDAWEPICRALNLSVPDQPFPHVNSTADYLAVPRCAPGRVVTRAKAVH